MRYAIVHCVTGVAGTRRFRATTRRANVENASDSWSKAAVVLLLLAPADVRHCVATAVVNGIAQSGRVGFAVVIVQKTREFLESAESTLVWARDCHDEHAACM
jgi:hypothetical protein